MATISAPTSLATLTHARASSSRLPSVTLAPVVGSSRLAVAAAHGDGVWTYDLKTLRPTTSFSVPSSTVFASAPASFYVKSGDSIELERERVTAVAVEYGEGVKRGAGGRALWLWRGEEAADKMVIELEAPCHSLQALEGAVPLVAVTSAGLVLFDDELAPRALGYNTPGAVVAARVTADKAGAVRAVLVCQDGNVHVIRVDDDDVRVVGTGSVGRELVRADVSEDGTIVGIDSANRVHTTHTRDLSASASPALALRAAAVAVLALPSPTHPLALIPSSSSLSLVIPTASLPAVLTTTPLASAGTVAHLALVASSPAAGTYTVAAVVALDGRSVVYTADVAVPPAGVGLNLVLASRARSAQLFDLDADVGHPVDADGQGAAEMLAEIGAALSAKDARAAEDRFAAWLKKQDEATQAQAHTKAVLPEPTVRRVVALVFGAAVSTTAKGEGDGDERARVPTGVYADKIVRALVDRRAVSDGMLDGGLVLAGLVPVRDIHNLTRLILSTPTLPSPTLAALLAAFLRAPDPALPQVLDALLGAAPPDPAFRAALRRQLGVDEAARLLEHLAVRLARAAERGDGVDQWAEDGRATVKSSALIQSLITHTSHLLDAHLPSLLTYEPAAALLSRVQAALAPLLAAQLNYRRLRAPVDAALTLAARERRRAAEAQAKRDAAAPQHARGDRKAAKDVPNLAPGDEVVGKWKVEDIVF
ncbi:hypothetical protein Q5752_001700 [Cryptotrichosporon argae]